MFTRIALVADEVSSLGPLRFELRNPIKFLVREFLSLAAVQSELLSFPMEVLILRTKEFDERHVRAAWNLRSKFPMALILFVSKSVDPSARLQAGSLSGVRILQESEELRDLSRVIENLKSVRGPRALRLHPRGERRDPVLITDEQGSVHSGRFVDFAQMGARIHVPTIRRASRFLQIDYESRNEPGQRNRLETRWIWSSDGAVGLRFVARY